MAAQATGPVIWIRPAHAPERLMPWAMRRFLSPGRLIVVEARGEADLLWASEESLRSGAAGFVIATPEKPLSLTAGRRLQLAAEAGRTTGLLLIREGGGSNAAETRWHCTPLPSDARDSTRAHWSLKKNKRGTISEYTVHWHGTAHSVPLVAPAGERDVAAPPPA
jgi:protein ImuA